jgi:transcriptional regulator with XRE-family HTH domain
MRLDAAYSRRMPIATTRPLSGPKLRALRLRRELSQQDLAQRCKEAGRAVTQGQISRLEHGHNRNPYMPLVRALATSLEAEVDDLLEEAAAPVPSARALPADGR